MKTFIETDRILLREIVESDAEDLFELDSDPEVHKYLGNNPTKHIQKSRDIIKDIRDQYERNGIGRWAVIDKTSGAFVGWSGLKYEDAPINDKDGYYDIGYRFKQKYWGKGYASESARVSLAYGFETLKWDKICGAAQIKNIGSNKVLQKIGLKLIESFTYKETECHWYELEREEWLNQQKNK